MNSNHDNIDIGFDPLAWMQDTESDAGAEKSSEPIEFPAQKMTTKSPAEDTGVQPLEERIETENNAENANTVMVAASGDRFRVNLAGQTNIGSAVQLKIELSDALNQDAPIILEAKEVERIDGAALQLLAAFVQKIVENERELIWDAPSDQFINTVNIVGLKETMQLP